MAPSLLGGCLPASFNAGNKAGLHTQPADYTNQTTELLATIKNEPNPATEAKTRLQLAGIYLSHNNPDKDYQKALKQLELFTLLDQDTGKSFEIQNWLAVLKEVNKEPVTEPLKKKINNLSDSLKRTEKISKEREQQNQKLAAENAELKVTIEKLKYLDLNLEKKRKNYR
ncbi:MAG: hypothetical protein KKB30_07845 [Proteobacteria bacterium]|nr:hypothetical protein [Pseudomonadota bacterium]MBU1716029.1 hypothetical protein [Pseudomonadota bacterium]